MLDAVPDIEAVIIATPDHTHAMIAMEAMRQKKHVYVQKPLTHDVYEARMLTEAAVEHDVVTQMGNQGHSGEGIRLIKEWVADGAIGNVTKIETWTNRPIWPQGIDRPEETPATPSGLDWDRYLGPAPTRPYHPSYHPFAWRGWWDFGTGALGDMGCHIMDGPFAALGLGYPTSVEASSSPVNSETGPLASIVRYEFPQRGKMPPLEFTWYDGGLTPARPEGLEPGRRMGDGGALLIGDEGTIMFGTYAEEPRIIPEAKMQDYTRPAKTLPRRTAANHEMEWAEACKDRSKAVSSPFSIAGPLTEFILLGNVAIRSETREKLLWDGENMEVTNLPEANQYVRREYREGWTL